MMNYKTKKDVHLSSFDNLILSIFVIGYKNIGESIVVLFRDKCNDEDKVVLSIVIDCYEIDRLNLTRTILKKFSIKYVDFICWTHPHTDHSLGIDKLIKDVMHDGLVIFTPKFYYGNLNPDLLKSESMTTETIYKNIHTVVKKHNKYTDLWRTVSADGDITHNYPMRLIANDDLSQKELCFYFLTPISRRTDKYSTKGSLLDNPNELSISFFMSVDGYNFYFGGDTENEHAKAIDTNIIKDFRWIKVPHHCSMGGKSIADRLGPMVDFAASTVYAPSKLPVEEIQNIYANSCHALHMTQLEEKDDYHASHKYGIIRYDYKFGADSIVTSIYTYGNAAQYFPSDKSISDEITNNYADEGFVEDF